MPPPPPEFTAQMRIEPHTIASQQHATAAPLVKFNIFNMNVIAVQTKKDSLQTRRQQAS